jgi:hypothetical protein
LSEHSIREKKKLISLSTVTVVGPFESEGPLIDSETGPIFDKGKATSGGPIKVGVIGAGLAGITAGVLLPAKLPGLDLRIYDKNADVVWY